MSYLSRFLMGVKRAPDGPKKTRSEISGEIASEVTNRIVEALEAGTRPWRRPWGAKISWRPPVRFDGKLYRGANVLTLWLAAVRCGYRSPIWMTFRQARELGGCVRKGERGTRVIYVGQAVDKDAEESGDEPRIFKFLKSYTVFNVEQIRGLPDRFYQSIESAEPVDRGTEANVRLLEWLGRTGVRYETSDVDEAFYDNLRDCVHLPPAATFESAESWAAVLLHEACHATGHSSRLGRDMGMFGSSAYAKEELVAEIGSAMLGARLGLEPQWDQSASYVQSWINTLKSDSRAALRASSAAQAAADWLIERGGLLDGRPEGEAELPGPDDKTELGAEVEADTEAAAEPPAPVAAPAPVEPVVEIAPTRPPEQLSLF